MREETTTQKKLRYLISGILVAIGLFCILNPEITYERFNDPQLFAIPWGIGGAGVLYFFFGHKLKTYLKKQEKLPSEEKHNSLNVTKVTFTGIGFLMLGTFGLTQPELAQELTGLIENEIKIICSAFTIIGAVNIAMAKFIFRKNDKK